MSDFEKYLDSGIDAMEKNNFSEAIALFQIAKDINTKNIRVHRLLGNCLRVIGRVNEAIDVYQEGLVKGYHAGTHERLLNCLNYTDNSPEYIVEEHKKWAEYFQKKYDSSKVSHAKQRKHGKKIRLGYVSADFKSHPVAYFLFPILRNHSRKSFEVIIYHNSKTQDAITKEFMALADEWNIIYGVSAKAAFNQIENDNIDILIDLSGHTSGNRLDVFALKPAGVQVTYLGYPNTTGLTTIDYRIVDAITDPVDIPGSWHSETLHRMKDCFLCFEPPKDKLGIIKPPETSSNAVTFGTFNKVSKITDKMIRAWTSILLQVADSRLILKSVGFDDAQVRDQVLNRFVKAGINDISRILLYKIAHTRSDHLLMYNQLDIALDTYPYNGTTTTIQALYMAVPVITLQGKSHISRVSSSILSSLGLHDLIAITEEDYINKAVRLANDKKALSTYKKCLRSTLMSSKLVNGLSFTRELEKFFHSIL